MIDLFNATGSFCYKGLTNQSGVTAARVLDPIFNINPACGADEKPLACEIRLRRPAFALIYIGINDLGFFDAATYWRNMAAMIDVMTDSGVIPILSTFVLADIFGDAKPAQFNQVIRGLAAEKGVPLIDLESVLRYYPNREPAKMGII